MTAAAPLFVLRATGWTAARRLTCRSASSPGASAAANRFREFTQTFLKLSASSIGPLGRLDLTLSADKMEMPNTKCRLAKSRQCRRFAHLTAKTSNVAGEMSTKQQKNLGTIWFPKPYLVPNLLVSAVNFVIFKWFWWCAVFVFKSMKTIIIQRCVEGQDVNLYGFRGCEDWAKKEYCYIKDQIVFLTETEVDFYFHLLIHKIYNSYVKPTITIKLMGTQ